MQSEQFQLHAQIEDRHWWFVARRRILRQLVLKVAPPTAIALHEYRKRSMVVDIGCGTGANLAALADEYRCVGVDTSAEAIDLAHRRFPGITCICGSTPQDVSQWLHQAAVVLMTDVLEHVADDRGLLASIVQACLPGTQILLTVPADMRLWSPHDEAFGHYRRYDVENLSAVWADLPVKARLISHFNTRLYPMVRAVRSISQWRGRTSGEAHTDFKLLMRPINAVLEACFAGEGRQLLRAVDTGRKPYRQGVSLIAILQREVETKPSSIPRSGIVTQGVISDANQAELSASVISTPIAL